MFTRKQLMTGAVLAGLALSGGGLTAVAVAQNAPAPAAPQAAPQRPHANHIEGRIAFLRTELKITDAQQAQWDKVAAAMRSNSAAMHQAFEAMRANRDAPKSAVDRLQAMTQISALRAQASQRFLDAFKPLYASLSDDQKKTADELLARHHHHFRRG